MKGIALPYAVDAGSNTISAFGVFGGDELALRRVIGESWLAAPRVAP